MKKFLMVLVFCAVLCLTAFAQNENDFYIDDNGELLCYLGTSTSVVIPAKIGNIPVLTISGGFGINLTSVTIPNGVTRIENLAFYNNRLTTVTIPASVTSIGDSAFEMNRLTSVTISTGVKTIGDGAFQSNQLTSVIIPVGVTSIGVRAFADNKLTNVTVPAGVTYIGDFAFYNNNLTSITIPGGVNSIGNGAFDIKFINFYNSNGKRAGTYVLDNGQWRMR